MRQVMDVYILGVVCLGLCLWVLHLQFKIKIMCGILVDIATGETVIEANEDTRTIRITRHKGEEVSNT